MCDNISTKALDELIVNKLTLLRHYREELQCVRQTFLTRKKSMRTLENFHKQEKYYVERINSLIEHWEREEICLIKKTCIDGIEKNYKHDLEVWKSFLIVVGAKSMPPSSGLENKNVKTTLF